MTRREEVLEQLIDVMREAEAAGREPWTAVRATYPGTPEAVIAEAWTEFEDRKVEAWWRQVERTIDGEVIRKALGAVEEGGSK